MPIPKPHPDEKESDFMSRCVSFMADEDPNMNNKQRVAICFDSFRKGTKGESMDEEYSEFNKAKSEKKYDEKGRIIVQENVKIIFNGTVDFSE